MNWRNGLADSPVIPVLTGCTASGKTGMLIDFQCSQGGLSVVSADSRQVYCGMNIGTAKPTADELQLLPHSLIDRITPAETFSAGRFAAEADLILSSNRKNDCQPVVAGGTVLYILALTGRLDPMPEAAPALRSVLEAMERDRSGTLYRMLSVMDPDRVSVLGERDTIRLIRALEILLLTGRRPSSLRRGGDAERRKHFRIAAVAIDRSELRERIWRRTRSMISGGLLDEVSELTAQGWDRGSALGRTIGYREVLDYFEGSIDTLDALAETIAASTWRLARRQTNMMGRIEGLQWINERSELDIFLLGED